MGVSLICSKTIGLIYRLIANQMNFIYLNLSKQGKINPDLREQSDHGVR